MKQRTRTAVRPDRLARLKAVLAKRQPDLTVLMEQVHKPHNFSAILRNCDAAGVLEAHAVPPKGGLDLHRRTSSSAAKWVPVVEHATPTAAADALRETGFTLVAADLAEGSVDYRKLDYTQPTAFVMGAEKFGLSDEGRSIADHTVTVPMHGMIPSLNVSVATALLLFEAVRQREEAGLYHEPRLPGERTQALLFEWSFPRIARLCQALGRPYPQMSDDGSLKDPDIWLALDAAQREVANTGC